MITNSLSNPPLQISRIRFVSVVFLPYAAGYFLSYLLRSINAVIAADLTAEFHLGAADLGLLTAVYFLTFAVAQLPLGTLLDRLEPNVVQSALMLFASVGALIFAQAHSFIVLVIGRGLIGLGAAATLSAALKTIVVWTPTERMPLATGMMVMFGALGALAATGPADVVAQHIGWRALFAVLAASMALSALAVLLAAPKATVRASPQRTALSLSAVYRDQRFWRIAPLCALGVGSSWSLQSLWAAPWMRDVQGFDQTSIVHQLGVMAFAVCIGGPIFGLLSTRLRGLGIKIEYLLLGTLALSFVAQLALILRWPLPLLLLWTTISAAGATTVLSSALISGYFPESLSARANGSLNLLHVGGALVLQSATGVILAQWPNERGAYPVVAYQVALAIPLILQLVALAWFLAPRRRPLPSMQYAISGPPRGPSFRLGSQSHRPPPSFLLSRGRNRPMCEHTGGWAFAALTSTVLCVALATAVLSAQRSSSLGVLSGVPFHPKNGADFILSSVALPQIVGKVAPMAIEGRR